MAGKRQWSLDDILYVILWGILVAAAVLAAVIYLFDISSEAFDAPCIFREITGLYCPGCGGTRAFDAFFHGHLWNAFLFHPAVVCVLVFCIVYLAANTVKYVSGGRFRGLRYRNRYCYAAVAVLLLEWGYKNYMLLVRGIYIIP